MNKSDLNGAFLLGAVIGIACMFFFYHPKYQDKTAEEWQALYQDLDGAHQYLRTCLNNMKVVPVNDNLYDQYAQSEYYKKSDVSFCLGY